MKRVPLARMRSLSGEPKEIYPSISGTKEFLRLFFDGRVHNPCKSIRKRASSKYRKDAPAQGVCSEGGRTAFQAADKATFSSFSHAWMWGWIPKPARLASTRSSGGCSLAWLPLCQRSKKRGPCSLLCARVRLVTDRKSQVRAFFLYLSSSDWLLGLGNGVVPTCATCPAGG